tara:strand:+ start:39 stop:269 length:231 start_codon:yes stop_codon:yes gene_type:complete
VVEAVRFLVEQAEAALSHVPIQEKLAATAAIMEVLVGPVLLKVDITEHLVVRGIREAAVLMEVKLAELAWVELSCL